MTTKHRSSLTEDSTTIEKQQAETDFNHTHRDEFAGQGGSYEIGPDGRRRRIGRTLTQDEARRLKDAGEEIPENR